VYSFICKFGGQYSKDGGSYKCSVGSSRDEDGKMAAEGNKWSRVNRVIKEAWAVRLPYVQGVQK